MRASTIETLREHTWQDSAVLESLSALEAPAAADEEAEEERARRSRAAKRERAKVALGMLSSCFERVAVTAQQQQVPSSLSHAVAVAPPFISTSGEGEIKESPRFFPAMGPGKLTSRPDVCEEKRARKCAQLQRFGGYPQSGAALDAQIGG